MKKIFIWEINSVLRHSIIELTTDPEQRDPKIREMSSFSAGSLQST